MIDDRLPDQLPEVFATLAPGFVVEDPKAAPALRWGILGAGNIARTFTQDVRAYSSQKVVAVGSRDQGRADAFAAEFGDMKPYGSYDALVAADDIDIIYVATPHSRHRDDALLALRAGKPVLVEKAFTMTLEEAEEIFATAKEMGLFAMEAMWSRHLPHYRYLEALIDGGNIGRVVSLHADHGQHLTHVPRLMEPELGGGSLHDLGVYSNHFANFVLGRPERISYMTRPTSTGVIAAEMIVGKYPGALSVASSNLDGISATAGQVTFERASFELPTLFYRPGVVTLRTFPEDGDHIFGEVNQWDATVPGGFQYQVAEAARCITAGLTESPVVPWQATLDVMWVLDQVAKGK